MMPSGDLRPQVGLSCTFLPTGYTQVARGGTQRKTEGRAGGPLGSQPRCEVLASCLIGYHFTPSFRLLKENCFPNWLFFQTSCNEAKLHSKGA